MRAAFIMIIGLCTFLFCSAQQSRADSLREFYKKDSVELEKEIQDINRMKLETDSLIDQEFKGLNSTNRSRDSAAMRKNLIEFLEQRKKEEQKDKELFYTAVIAFAIMTITVLVFFKRKPINKQEENK